MNWTTILVLVVLLFVSSAMKNRRLKPLYAQLEEKFAEVLAGRFEGKPVWRRKFMRALFRYACERNGARMAYGQFKSVQKHVEDEGDKMACELLMGMCMEEMGAAGSALEAYEKVMAGEGPAGVATRRRAHLLAQMDDERALAAYEAILRERPDDPVQRINYASALIRLGDPAYALEQLEQAEQLGRELRSVHELKMLAYVRLGREEEADAALERAVAEGGDEASLQQILDEELQELWAKQRALASAEGSKETE